jgi:uncharacterized secreted protein with C-terminal beta-propeller domain
MATRDTGGALVVVAVALLMGAAVGGAVTAAMDVSTPAPPTAGGGTDDAPATGSTDADATDGDAAVVAFDSPAAFQAYLARAPGSAGHAARARPDPVPQARAEPTNPEDVTTVAETAETAVAAGDDGGNSAGGAAAATRTPVATSTPTAAPVPTEAADTPAESDGVERASGTNVQVSGVDEPDVVKTLGGTTAYAVGNGRSRAADSTVLLNTSDPAAPAVAGRVDESGRLAFADGGDLMLVLTGESVVAYDVTDRSDPVRQWERGLDGRVAAARLTGGRLYLVVADGVDPRAPCPVEPAEGVAVDCDRVFHPRDPAPADTTYTTMAVRPTDGNVTDAVSFVGSAATAATYVSRSSVYVAYVDRTDDSRALLEFLLSAEEGYREDLPPGVIDRLETIRSYDLGPRARRAETGRTVESWLSTLDDDERDRVREELVDRFDAYREAHKRDLSRTGLVRVDYGDRDGDGTPDGLTVAETGSVAGVPLNQFSMSEADGRLRIATTVSADGTTSENDLYVLNRSLDVVGSVTGMGLTERVYSVRFVGDTAYVVTFRRVDPFHVVDLSDPTDPELQGELKLPGFSSYLHPLPDDRVLGIGEEDGRVKLVVFDVSDPTDPTIADDRILDARFSAVAETHRAFLMDRNYGVFFLPTPEAGYVYSYEGDGADTLTREATVPVDGARRAIYLDDYMYVFGDREAVVVDETTWEVETTIRLTR